MEKVHVFLNCLGVDFLPFRLPLVNKHLILSRCLCHSAGKKAFLHLLAEKGSLVQEEIIRLCCKLKPLYHFVPWKDLERGVTEVLIPPWILPAEWSWESSLIFGKFGCCILR